MIITSDKIRALLKTNFDQKKMFLQKKLYKTDGLKDKKFYAPSLIDFRYDYKKAREEIADDLNVSLDCLIKIGSGDDGIWDCDNYSLALSAKLKTIHHRRYLNKEHDLKYEYAIFTCEVLGHSFNIVFVEQGIYFADLMVDYIWSIKENKPMLIKFA